VEGSGKGTENAESFLDFGATAEGVGFVGSGVSCVIVEDTVGCEETGLLRGEAAIGSVSPRIDEPFKDEAIGGFASYVDGIERIGIEGVEGRFRYRCIRCGRGSRWESGSESGGGGSGEESAAGIHEGL
jgi:hypothetical protein